MVNHVKMGHVCSVPETISDASSWNFMTLSEKGIHSTLIWLTAKEHSIV
jgi:hypothetical protein